ncbi:hypothetical protein MASR2M66_01270 [Chloroflexota bacterium]
MKRDRKKARRQQVQDRIHLVRALFHINSIVWLLIGIWFVWQMYEDGNRWSALYVFLFFVCAAGLLQVGVYFLKQPDSLGYSLVIAATVINLLLTFFSIQNFLFVPALLLDLIILAILIPLKSYFFNQT